MSLKQSGRPRRADALALLEQGHRTLRELLAQLASTTPRATRSRAELLARLGHELRIHARLEEQVFYPAFREAAGPGKNARLFFEALEEHALADFTLSSLEDATPESALFGARCKVLKDVVEHHMDEEERDVLPLAKRLLGAQERAQLAAEMNALERELRAQPLGRASGFGAE